MIKVLLLNATFDTFFVCLLTISLLV